MQPEEERSANGDTSAMTEELSAPEKLTNHMTENERSKISVGELTVFDHEQKEQEPIVPTDGVYLELWTYDDSLADYKNITMRALKILTVCPSRRPSNTTINF